MFDAKLSMSLAAFEANSAHHSGRVRPYMQSLNVSLRFVHWSTRVVRFVALDIGYTRASPRLLSKPRWRHLVIAATVSLSKYMLALHSN